MDWLIFERMIIQMHAIGRMIQRLLVVIFRHARIPVVSAGLSARVNLLGYAVIEAYYARPFQRPGKGWVYGIQLAPGW